MEGAGRPPRGSLIHRFAVGLVRVPPAAQAGRIGPARADPPARSSDEHDLPDGAGPRGHETGAPGVGQRHRGEVPVGPDLRWSTAVVTRTRAAAAEAPQVTGADEAEVVRVPAPSPARGEDFAERGDGAERRSVLTGEGAGRA